ncbi:MobC family mobilization protein [Tatumella ptyseos ATCC 33301]|uniref:MobC family mobilization protein n=1 Tax=Tatumella ptyseos ATCC 33301 TaxID=1005995 RepID=A0A085JDD7_9GAMM|nr:plasmid mobilization relaxosome protein MobC [Tatumella ptyseos]KFD18483.1 MobC family mobilization protein [Tatumella ptyseos ATCC 33301]
MLTLWVTEDEHRRLPERCDGKQLAAAMCQTYLAAKPVRAGILPSISPALLRQLIGGRNNLNQTARRVNRGQWSGNARVQVLHEQQQKDRVKGGRIRSCSGRI